jgi:heme exporter protein A
MNGSVTLTGTNLKKVFDHRTIFRDVSFSVQAGATLLITGRNGSGKSTLVKIITRVLSPTAGSVALRGGAAKETVPGPQSVGLVSPYLQLFEEFSAIENLELAMGLRGMTFDRGRAQVLLDRVGLARRKDDLVRTYSSGMKQRAKYAFALLHAPTVLVLDEPMANLDGEGIAVVRSVMNDHRAAGILVVATNDLTDVDAFDEKVDLNDGH